MFKNNEVGVAVVTDALQIIRLLADGEFHSGEELGRLVGVSRAAVWKRLQHLQTQFGLRFESVRGRGYRLAGGIELLDVSLIRMRLSPDASDWLQHFEVHERIGSTNRRASELVREGVHSGAIVVAESQTEGSGRRGRPWLSPFGRNIYLSALWSFEGGVAALEGLSLVIGVVVARVIAPLTKCHIELKWPNDVLVDSRKLAGILLEVVGDLDGRCTVVIGIGINVRMSGAEGVDAIGQPWTDVESVADVPVSRNTILSALIEQMVSAMRLFEREGLSPFLHEWDRLDCLKGCVVSTEAGGRMQTGVAVGIDASGALLLEIDGAVQAVHGGEISVRIKA